MLDRPVAASACASAIAGGWEGLELDVEAILEFGGSRSRRTKSYGLSWNSVTSPDFVVLIVAGCVDVSTLMRPWTGRRSERVS